MSDIGETVIEAVDKVRESRINSVVALSVAITATFTALCNVKDGNIVQAMAQAQANAVDTWSYFQAKSTKESIALAAVDQLRLERDIGKGLAAETRALIDARIADYEAKVKGYDAEKKEIEKTAQGYQQEYDRLNYHDDQFDMAEALMSIGIALYGITALTQKRALLVTASLFAGIGVVLGLSGFLGLHLHPKFLADLLT